MNLKDLLKNLDEYEICGPDHISIHGIEYDSRKVKPGSLFVAVPGFKQDGRQFITEAVKAGAVAVVLEGSFFDNLNMTQIRVRGARLALAQLSAEYFAHPTRSLYVAGVTGTNGKTTLTYLIESLWQSAGRSPGVIGTINARYDGTLTQSVQTTPESVDLQSIFYKMKDKNVSHVCMEVSSHALILNRVKGIEFDSCLFTNLTQDHLDFHKTMHEYYQAKQKLFVDHLQASSKSHKIALINRDDPMGQKLFDQLKALKMPVQSYGCEKDNDLYPVNYELGSQGIKAQIRTPQGELKIKTTLMGRFNLSNLMAALLLGLHAGLNLDDLQKGVSKLKAPPGRLELIPDPKGRIVFVDYAHTPDALKNVLSSLKEIASRRLIVIFGCGGDRDASKRPVMGFEAAQKADICIVTSDNPRTEDPQKIINDILPGIEKAKMKEFHNQKGYWVESDRKKAIHRGLSLSQKDDIVLVAGKGHEDYQIVGHQKVPFSDQQIIGDYLEMKKCE